jgi:hypothetical protein
MVENNGAGQRLLIRLLHKLFYLEDYSKKATSKRIHRINLFSQKLIRVLRSRNSRKFWLQLELPMYCQSSNLSLVFDVPFML